VADGFCRQDVCEASFDFLAALFHNRQMPRLPFITFEGSEGSGKSTQADRLAVHLQRCNIPYILTREPGGTPIGESIRDLLQFAPHNSNMTPETELLERGICVIADRFFDSTTVYQGAARKLDPEMIERLNAFVVGDFVPDITFVLDVDAATAESRMQHEPRKADRMEQQPAEFYDRVREGYRDLAAHEPKRIVLIDASGDVDEIEKQIWKTLSSCFSALTKTSNP
jgi:dTMP kinase